MGLNLLASLAALVALAIFLAFFLSFFHTPTLLSLDPLNCKGIVHLPDLFVRALLRSSLFLFFSSHNTAFFVCCDVVSCISLVLA